MPFAIDPEVGATLRKLFGVGPAPKLAKGDYEARRQLVAGLFGSQTSPLPSTVRVEDYHTTAEDEHKILCRWYKKEGTESGSPAVVYYHGGGYIGGSVNLYDGILGKYVDASGIPFLSIEYRLAPESQYPVNVKDAFAGLEWLFDHAEELGVDPSRIAVMGDSAGGGMCAAVTHWNLEVGKNLPIIKQILVYPMLDDRNTKHDSQIGAFAIWDHDDNATGWGCLLGDNFQNADLKPSAAPGRLKNAAGLPPAYIDTGELDIFRNEILIYAAKLGLAGISTETHIYAGCPHAFEVFASEAEVSKRCFADRIRTLKGLWKDEVAAKL